jgi:hypothetical protein
MIFSQMFFRETWLTVSDLRTKGGAEVVPAKWWHKPSATASDISA